MIDLAIILLAVMLISTIWDVADPYALEVKVNSWPRATLSLVTAIGFIVLGMLVIGATAWQIIAALSVWLALATLRAAL